MQLNNRKQNRQKFVLIFQSTIEYAFYRQDQKEYNNTFDVSNVPILTGEDHKGREVSSFFTHYINLKSTGKVQTNAGCNVFGNTKTIKLNNNKIGEDITAPLLKSLYYQKLNLNILDLSHNHLTDGFVGQFLDCVKVEGGKQEHNIKCIIINNNNITDKGAGNIATALTNGDLKATKHIDVSDNKITPIGCGYFINAMNVNKTNEPLAVTLHKDIKPVVEFITKGFKYAVQQHSNQPHSYKEFHKVVSNKNTEQWHFCKKTLSEGSLKIAAGVFKCPNKSPQGIAFCVAKESYSAVLNPDTLTCIAEVNKAIDDTDLIGDSCTIF